MSDSLPVIMEAKTTQLIRDERQLTVIRGSKINRKKDEGSFPGIFRGMRLSNAREDPQESILRR